MKSAAIFSKTALAILIIFSCLGHAEAVIVSYQFPNSVFTPTITDPGVSASSVNNVGSSAGIQPGNAYPNSIFLAPKKADSTTPFSAVANNEYMQFSVTPIGNKQINLTSFTFDAGRGGPQVPRGWVLRSSIDQFAANISTNVIPTVVPTLTPFTVDLSGAAFQHLSSTTTFRIYGYIQLPNSGQGLFFDNLTLNGSVMVPEPSTLAMLLTIAVSGLLYWRRNRKAV